MVVCVFHLCCQVCGHRVVYNILYFTIITTGSLVTNFFFIFVISNLHLVWFFSWLTWLELYQFYWSFQKAKFLVLLIFLCCFPVFNVIDFHSNFYHFFSYVCFSLYFSSFSSFLTWKPRLYIVDLSSFLCAFSTVNFTPLLLLHFTNSDNLSFQCDLLENIPVSPETSLTYLAIRSVLFNLLIFWHFVAIFLLLISSLIFFFFKKKTKYEFYLSHLP